MLSLQSTVANQPVNDLNAFSHVLNHAGDLAIGLDEDASHRLHCDFIPAVPEMRTPDAFCELSPTPCPEEHPAVQIPQFCFGFFHKGSRTENSILPACTGATMTSQTMQGCGTVALRDPFQRRARVLFNRSVEFFIAGRGAQEIINAEFAHQAAQSQIYR